MTASRVYLDHAASAPLDPAARAAILAALEVCGNPSSPHAEGRRTKDLLEGARDRVAATLGCRPREVLFTGSGTLASQIALLGLARARREASRRVVLSAVEHPAVADGALTLEREGFEVVRVPPRADGSLDPGAFIEAASPGAAAAALMRANHETGAVLPVAAVGSALAARGIPLFSDACLAPGRLPLAGQLAGLSALALSAHKFGGPRGLGILWLRRRTRLEPLFSGGLQEERVHPGTEAVAAAQGAAAALESAVSETPARAARYRRLASLFLDGLADLRDWTVLGPAEDRVPGLLTLELPGVEGEAATINLDLEGFAVATGSTCALGATEPSASLLAMGLSRRRAATTVRVSFGEGNSEQDATRAADAVRHVASRLRGLARP